MHLTQTKRERRDKIGTTPLKRGHLWAKLVGSFCTCTWPFPHHPHSQKLQAPDDVHVAQNRPHIGNKQYIHLLPSSFCVAFTQSSTFAHLLPPLLLFLLLLVFVLF